MKEVFEIVTLKEFKNSKNNKSQHPYNKWNSTK